MKAVIDDSSSLMTVASASATIIDEMESPPGHLPLRNRQRSAAEAEPFIDSDAAAAFVKLNRKTLLRYARAGLVPAYPVTGAKRRKWRFLLSDLDAWARAKVNSTSDPCQNSRRE
jgi:hypothetical protein